MDIIDEGIVLIQSLNKEWHEGKVTSVDMLRLDLLHPVISGNKWYKLKKNIEYALSQQFKSVLTFGGAYSNHLVATAAATQQANLHSIGIVRGNPRDMELTKTLLDCKRLGMELHFVSREEYNKKNDPDWLKKLAEKFSEAFIVPEGGANEYGRFGSAEIKKFVSRDYTHVAVSVGTGTTMIGLRNALPVSQKLLGFVPMKNGTYLKEYISNHLLPEKNDNWQLFDVWHFGGFGKWNNELIHFMNSFYVQNNIALDIVYTSKMMYGIKELIQKNFFDQNAKIICIHTGGGQGNVSIKDKLNF